MPITVTASRGVFTVSGEREILPRLTEILAKASGLAGNEVFTSLIGGTVHILPKEDVYAGGRNRPLVLVELKLPNIGLPNTQARAEFITEATDAVAELTVARHDRSDIWVNILNAPDGGWGIGGTAYTGDELIAAVMR